MVWMGGHGGRSLGDVEFIGRGEMRGQRMCGMCGMCGSCVWASEAPEAASLGRGWNASLPGSGGRRAAVLWGRSLAWRKKREDVWIAWAEDVFGHRKRQKLQIGDADGTRPYRVAAFPGVITSAVF